MSDSRALALVNAVMGEMFPGEGLMDPLMLKMLAQQGGRRGSGGAGGAGFRLGGRGGGFRLAPAQNYVAAAGGRPEGMIKIIRKGGCSSRSDLRSRSPEAARYADQVMARHAQAFDRLAGAFTKAHRDIVAVLMRECGGTLRRGEEIIAEPTIPKADDIKSMGDARAMVLSSVDEADQRIRTERDSASRTRMEHELGPIKGRAAVYAPDRADLAPYALAVPENAELYRSEALQRAKAHGIDTVNRTETARARYEIQDMVKGAGLDGRAFAERYELGGPKEAGTAAAWAAQDMVAIMQHRGIDPETASRSDMQSASKTLDHLHDRAERMYEAGVRADGVPERQTQRGVSERDRIGAVSGQADNDPAAAERLSLLAREARAAIENSKERPATMNEVAAERDFVAAIDRQTSRDERNQLERGQSNQALQRLMPNASRTERADMALTYLESRRDLTDEQTRGHYADAIRITRDERTAAKAAERAAERGPRSRDSGNEL